MFFTFAFCSYMFYLQMYLCFLFCSFNFCFCMTRFFFFFFVRKCENVFLFVMRDMNFFVVTLQVLSFVHIKIFVHVKKIFNCMLPFLVLCILSFQNQLERLCYAITKKLIWYGQCLKFTWLHLQFLAVPHGYSSQEKVNLSFSS